MKLPQTENPYNHRILTMPFMQIDLDIVGHIILNKDKNYFKIMLFERMAPDMGYFRGQNKNFPTFQTSWQRLNGDFERCLAWIQKKEFILWFMRTPYFHYFSSCIEFVFSNDIPEGQGAQFCFDFEAIAQHYEFATNYLDITTKKDVAKFFAYTYVDHKTGLYRPIEDFSCFEPHLFSSKYASSITNIHNPDVRIVGFQPLLRPINQFAMAISYENPQNDYNQEFYKEALPKDKAEAFRVFDQYEGGGVLFPDDYPSFAAKLIKCRAKSERVVKQSLLAEYCKKFSQNPKDMEEKFKNAGYVFSEDDIVMSETAIHDMQKHIDQKLVPWLHEYVRYSPRFP